MFYLFYSSNKEIKTNARQKYYSVELEKDSKTGEIKFKSSKSEKHTNTSQSKIKTEVFKEPDDIPMSEQDEQEEISKLDKNSKEIIDETEKFIKQDNLELPREDISQQEKEKLQKYDEELQKLEEKLEELSDE